MGETARIWQGLLQRVVEANSDIVSSKRLKGHLDRFAEKYPLLQKVSVSEGRVEFRDDFPEDDSGLLTLSTIIGVLYWTLDTFTGPTTAAERLRKPLRDYIEKNLPPGTVIGLNRFLPKLHLEKAAPGDLPDPVPSGAAAEFSSARGAPPPADGGGTGGAAFPAEGAARELWERSTEDGGGGPGPVSPDAGVETGGTEGAEFPGEELAAQYPGTVPWLGEDIPRGCSLLVEGAGDAKERCALRFIREGLEGGESVLALIAYPPDEFRRRLSAEECDAGKAEEEGRLKILDWASFREKHIEDLEDDGPVMRLPMELPWVGAAINMALNELPQSSSPRAFVNILPRALATVAIETVFNFVQITILKFKRKKMTGLFIMEEEKDPEKGAIRLSFNSWVEIGETGGPGENLSVRLGGPILRSKRKEVSYADGKWTVLREEAVPSGRKEGPEPPYVAELRQAVGEWRSQGYDVSELEGALGKDPDGARRLVDAFGDRVSRLRTIRNDLRILDLSGLEDEAAGVQALLQDVGRVEQAEGLMQGLRQKLERRRLAARERVQAGALEAQPAAGAPPDGAPLRDASSEARQAAELRRRDTLRKDEEAVRRGQEEARRREEAERKSRDATAEDERRREFRETIAKWKEEGYVVRPLEEVVELDLERVRRDFLLFRVQLQRLRELGEELAAIDQPRLAGRKSELATLLKDVSRIPDIERGVEELRASAARMLEGERQRKEDEQGRRAALSEKLFWWASHGLPVERLERLLDGDLPTAEGEFASFEPGAVRLIRMKEELAALDTSEFKEAAARLEARLNDVDKLDRAETEFTEFLDFMARHSREARERKIITDELEGWRAKGIRVEAIEKILDRDLETVRSEVRRFGERAAAAEAVSAQLSKLGAKGFETRAQELREALRDPARLEDCLGAFARLQADIERASSEELERAGYRRRIEGWKKGGLQTRELGELLDKDLPALRRAIIEFQFSLDIHDELVQLLEPLARTRHAEEAGRLQKDLRDFSRLPELEVQVLSLRTLAEGELLASGAELSREFERDFALLEKLRGWIAGGYQVRRLEGVLRQDHNALRSEIERLEKDIEELSKEASALEVLDTKGLERELAHIRSLLTDPEKLPVVRALRDALRAEIARRKKEQDRRKVLRSVAREWEQKGYRVKHLHEELERDLEKAAQEFVLFRTRMAAAEHLRRRVDDLELLGLEAEPAALRKRLAETDSLAEVKAELDRLWKSVEEKGRDKAARKKSARERKRALMERLVGFLDKGQNVSRLEHALELPPDQAEAEFARFEQDVSRLRALDEKLGALSLPGLSSELAALRSRLDDVDRIAEVEKGLSALLERAERARREELDRQEKEKARLAEEERRAALRRRLEERLKEWTGFGLNVEPLRSALAADLALAEKRFSEFENSICRTEELKLELHALMARGLEGVTGAETIERMLSDPLKLPQAERAFADFRERAEAAIREKDAEMQEFVRRIQELQEKGEDVSALERAGRKGLAEVRQAFAEFGRELVNRERMETWKEVKSRLLLGPAGPADRGAGRTGAPEGTGAAPGKGEAEGSVQADGARAADAGAPAPAGPAIRRADAPPDGKSPKKKVRKVKK